MCYNIKMLDHWVGENNDGYVVDLNENTATIQMLGVTSGPWNELLEKSPQNYNAIMNQLYSRLQPYTKTIWVPSYEDVLQIDFMLPVLIIAAKYAKLTSSAHACVWLGSPNGADDAYFVDAGGVGVSFGYRDNSFAVAPAFIIDRSRLIRDENGNLKIRDISKDKVTSHINSVSLFGDLL